MKKNIIFTFLFAAFLGLGFGQAQNKNKGAQMDQKLTPEQKAQKAADRLEKKLTLTPDQKTKVYDLTLSKINKTRETRGKDSKDKKSQGEAFKTIRREYNADMNEILTPEQEVKWEQLKTEAKARRVEKKNGTGQKDNNTDDPEKDLDLELE